jgi:two-component system nitrate/nitrite sensor histidine kinase NarX
MNFPSLPHSRRLSDKLTAISIGYLVVALAAVGVTLVVAWQLEGGAAAVNAMGSERMRSYHIGMLLAESAATEQRHAELADAVRTEIAAFEQTLAELATGDPSRPLVLPRTRAIQARFSALQSRWQGEVRPAIASLLAEPSNQARAQALPRYRAATDSFVQQIDALVMSVEREISDKTALLRTLQLGLVALSLIGAVALIYLMFLLIVRPVTRLEEGMRSMAAGDFDVRLPVETRDEFGMLATGFNRMAEHLAEAYRTLERRVADKTRTLAAKNEELGTLYELAALLAEPSNAEELCRSFLRNLAARMGAQAGAVRLIQADSGQLHLFAQEGLASSFTEEERCLDRGECLCGEAAQRQHGGVYLLKRIERMQPEYRRAAQGFATISVFPIRFRNQLLGIFNLYFAQPRELAAPERQMLETLGKHLGIAIESQRLTAREKEMAISEERNLLAQELHDSIAQSLAFLNIQAQLLEDSLAKGRAQAATEELARIREGIQASYDDVRELLVHFRTRLAQADIESAIASTLERFEGQTGIRATFVQSGAAMPLSPETQIQVLHIIQECLSNARKHSGAASVRVEMERAPRYRFRVLDDGGGFDPARVTSDMHVGLRIMRERAHRIGATLAVRSQPGQGTEVTLELPPPTEHARTRTDDDAVAVSPEEDKVRAA